MHVHYILAPSRSGSAVKRPVVLGATALIANSDASAKPWRRSSRPISVIPNGIDLTRFDPAAVPPVAVTALRTELGLGSRPILTIVGQVTPSKGQADAIDIARLLRRHQPNAQLMIVGRAVFDSQTSRFDNLAYELKLLGMARALPDGAIVFAGERDDIPTVLAASDVLLVPSWMEPFGRVVVEGMAMGLPVFATRGGGPSEIITDGIDGVLLPLSRPDIWASRIRALLADEAA